LEWAPKPLPAKNEYRLFALIRVDTDNGRRSRLALSQVMPRIAAIDVEVATLITDCSRHGRKINLRKSRHSA
jgi:hypothetical protein